MRAKWMAVALGVLLGGCGGATSDHLGVGSRVVTPIGQDAGGDAARSAPNDAGSEAGADGSAPQSGPKPCADIYADALLPTYAFDVTTDVWNTLYTEFKNVAANAAAGVDIHPYHPLTFRYGNETYPDAMVRLKGESTWRAAAAHDDPGKMQFVVSFNETNPDGRFHGVRKVELDMPRDDPTFLSTRMGTAFLRDVGLPAQCANNARLEVNGAYYGLFTNVEHVDKEFLQRNFPGAADGNLWKNGTEIETNKTTADPSRLEQLFAVTTMDAFLPTADVTEAISAWAGEAVIPSGDGYWAAGDYFLYEHPTRGFLWIPYDLDTSFNNAPVDADPITYWSVKGTMRSPGIHYDLVMADADWRARYVADLRQALAAYDIARLQKRVDDWSAQIDSAAHDDPTKPFGYDDYLRSVADLRAYPQMRADFVASWLAGPGPTP